MEQQSGEPLEQWRRVHPLTPLMRGWFFLVALFLFIGRNLLEDFDEVKDLFSSAGWWLLLGIVVVLGLVVLVSWISWRATKYQLAAEAFHYRTGIIFRQNRRVPLNRVQSVDINQPLLARLFALASVRIESAGGADSNVELSFLPNRVAKQLRTDILAHASGPQPVATTAATDVPEAEPQTLSPSLPPEQSVELLVDLPLNRLLISRLRSASTVFFGITVLVTVALLISLFFGNRDGLGLMLVVFGAGVSQWRTISKNYGTRVSSNAEGIHIKRGLTDLRTQNIAPGRIAAVSVSQPPFWRKPDWWNISVSVAGYSMAEAAARESGVLTTVATRAEVENVLRVLLPEATVQLTPQFLQSGMHGFGDDQWFTTSSRRARFFSPINWRRSGFAVLDAALVVRKGRWWRSVHFVEHHRSQGVSVAAGPWDHRLGLADFTVHLTDTTFEVAHLDAVVAEELLRAQAERARLRKRKISEPQ